VQQRPRPTGQEAGGAFARDLGRRATNPDDEESAAARRN
jgi:hypothetical protein